MATPKQTRAIIKKIMFHQHHLHNALIEAHRLKVIDYSEQSYSEHSPQQPYWEMDHRIEKTTEKALANAMRTEIKRGIK